MTQTRQLFGTDGIRGVAGEFPLTRESTYLIGRALGHDLIRGNAKARVVIGQDTRESSRWIADRNSGNQRDMVNEEQRMRGIMQSYRIPQDVPFDAIASQPAATASSRTMSSPGSGRQGRQR